jgi:hypothetical protein
LTFAAVTRRRASRGSLQHLEEDMPNDTETGLLPSESRDLRRLAGLMIPANDEFDVPGADDMSIFTDIERSLGRDRDDVRAALAALSTLAGGAFADLDAAQATAVMATFHARGGPAVSVLGRAILQCYYRDDRVVRSLGLEPRPPFPLGHALEQGDWSLLDAVRGRPRMWRDDRPT